MRVVHEKFQCFFCAYIRFFSFFCVQQFNSMGVDKHFFLSMCMSCFFLCIYGGLKARVWVLMVDNLAPQSSDNPRSTVATFSILYFNMLKEPKTQSNALWCHFILPCIWIILLPQIIHDQMLPHFQSLHHSL